MHFFLFLTFFSMNLWAKPLVIVGHFDPFGIGLVNNSQTVATELEKRFKDHPEIILKICSLETIFDKSFAQLEDCLKNETQTPSLILGLGEGKCRLKIETLARNQDKTYAPDNAGNSRDGTLIIPEGKRALGFNYPLTQMYCALGSSERKDITVSNDAGSFVCNNVAYQFRHFYPEEIFGFIHVPEYNCRNLQIINEVIISQLQRMILKAVEVKNHNVLPTTRLELKNLRNKTMDRCSEEFYSRAKGIDERDLWPFSD